MPVKGNIDKPDFDLSLIINKAMGKAMKSASLSYLKHLLQPYGSLITLFSLAKKAASHISLPPILFETNSLAFKAKQQDLLDKVLTVMAKRPGLKIKACGISSLQDQIAIKGQLIEAEKNRLEKAGKIAIKELSRNIMAGNKKTENKKAIPKEKVIVISDQAIQQKMQQLADQRSAKVKNFFLEKGGLKSSRILNCLSFSNTEEKSNASVELLI